MGNKEKAKTRVVAKPKPWPKAAVEADASQKIGRPKDPICAACKQRPSASREWAEHVVVGKEKDMRATGEKCMHCFQNWQKGFPYLSWLEYVQTAATEELSKHWLGTLLPLTKMGW